MENLIIENSTENDVCKLQVAIIHHLGGVLGTDRHTNMYFLFYIVLVCNYNANRASARRLPRTSIAMSSRTHCGFMTFRGEHGDYDGDINGQ